MGLAASKLPADTVRRDALASKEAIRLYTLCWHGCPPQKGATAEVQPQVPLYDSDDETTDSAVISALAMTDPNELRQGYRQAIDRTASGNARAPVVHAPILSSLSHQQRQHSERGKAAAAAGVQQQPSPILQPPPPGINKPSSTSSTSSSSSSQPRRLRCKDTTMTAAAAASAAAAAAARQPGTSSRARMASGPLTTSTSTSSSSSKASKTAGGRVIVPLSAAALDAVGAPCRIGGDLPPPSLQSQRGSAADTVGVRPFHHLNMMKLHRQQQQKPQAQAAMCVQAQAQSVWGWQLAGSAAQVAAT